MRSVMRGGDGSAKRQAQENRLSGAKDGAHAIRMGGVEDGGWARM